jgi:DnaJ-class molecular chaperone
MEKQIKKASHKYICDKCKGNGYIKIYDMVVQCAKCKSQGELTMEEPTLEELNGIAASARLQ